MVTIVRGTPQAARIEATLTLTGADASAAAAEMSLGTHTGFLQSVTVNYDAGQPATADVTVYVKRDGVDVNLAVFTNNGTDTNFVPLLPAHVASSGAVIQAAETVVTAGGGGNQDAYNISQQRSFLCKERLYAKAAQGDAGTAHLSIVISPN